MGKLQEMYQEELLADEKKPELTSIQRWTRYIREVMIQDAGNAFIRYYKDIMEGNFNGELFDNSIRGVLLIQLQN